MQDGKKGTAKPDQLVVMVKDEPDVPDWLERIAKMNGAAEHIRMGVRELREATKDTRWEIDALDLATQIMDLVEEDHDSNSIEDLVEDIKVIEGLRKCRK